MNTKQGDLLNTQGNAENNPKQNSPLIERKPIPGTPFTLINQNEKWFIVMGDYRLTEPTKTHQQSLKKLETEKWLIITTIIAITVKKIGVENNDYKNYEARIKKLQEEIPNYETESL